MQLSTGPWSYNRFDAFEQSLTEGAKPDFLDMDKDGDKKESFKKAVSDKKKDCDCKDKENCDCDKKSKKDDKKPAFLQKEGNCYQMGGKVKANGPAGTKSTTNSSTMMNAKDKGPAGTKSTTKSSTMLNVKEQIVQSLMKDGLANNVVSAEVIAEHMSEAWAEAILNDAE